LPTKSNSKLCFVLPRGATPNLGSPEYEEKISPSEKKKPDRGDSENRTDLDTQVTTTTE
jgi:hypothetical protein